MTSENSIRGYREHLNRVCVRYWQSTQKNKTPSSKMEEGQR